MNENQYSQLLPINSLSIPPGYKQTEVGVIPEDWQVMSFGDIVNYTKGYAFKSSEYEADGIRIIRVSDTTYNSIKDNDAVFVSERSATIYSKWILKENDLIFSTVGSKPPMYDSLVGKVILISSDYSGSLLNQNAVLIRAKNFSESIQKLLLNHFRLDRYIKYIEIIFRGNANQASITLIDLFNYKIPIPPTKAEQEAIAEALSDADAFIESLEQLIAKKRRIKQGAMQELLTGKKRLPGFSGEWEAKRLGTLATVQRGASPRPIDSPIWFDENSLVGWVRITDVSQSGMFLIETTQRLSILGIQHSRPVRYGSLIMSICATVGRPVITKIDTCIHDGFVVFDNLKVDKYFLYYVLKFIEDDWSKHGQTGSQMNLNTGLINLTKIHIPPVTKEQSAIASILSDMDAEIAALETKLTKARQIKQGMMHNLLTGRIRLV